MNVREWATVVGIIFILSLVAVNFSEVTTLRDTNKAYKQENLELLQYKNMYDSYGLGCEL